MATYTKTLKEDNGDITYPQTLASAVFTSDNSDVQTKLNSCVTATEIAPAEGITPSITTSMIQDNAVTAAKITGGTVLSTLANGALVEVIGTTTDDFNYALKYADGRLICLQRYTFSGKTASADGNIYRAINVITPVNYAISFTALPSVSASYTTSSGGWNGWLMTSFDNGYAAASASHPNSYSICRSSGGTNITGVIDIIAYGFWK